MVPQSRSDRRRSLRHRALRLGLIAAALHVTWLALLILHFEEAGTALLFVTLVPWCMTAAAYARSKGYSRAWGWAGLMAPLSLLGIAVLPDRNREESVSPLEGDYPRPNSQKG